MKRLTYLFVLLPVMVCCKKHISPAPKLFEETYLQYSMEKWLPIGDSLVFTDCFRRPGSIPVCQLNDKLDNLSFTRISPDSSDKGFSYKFRFLRRSINDIRFASMKPFVPYVFHDDGLIVFKIVKELPDKVLLKIWYNHTGPFK